MTIHVIQKIIVEDIVSAKIVAKKLNAQISEIMKDPTNHFAEGSISVVEVVSEDRWMQKLDEIKCRVCSDWGKIKNLDPSVPGHSQPCPICGINKQEKK